MRRALLLGLSAALAGLALARPAHAQTFARREVAPGGPTGLEMGIDGSLAAPRGGRLRWFVTLYEVLDRRELSPAAGATLRVTTAHAGGPVHTATTDARGRATLEIPIPDDPDAVARVRVEASSPRGVSRVFSVALEPRARHAVELMVDRARAVPGATVAVFGRVRDRVDGRPLEGVEVTVRARRDGAPVAPARTLRTDASGVYATTVPVGDGAGAVALEARTERGGASTGVRVAPSARGPLWLRATPERRVAPAGATVRVEVRARTHDGAPIEGATVEWEDERFGGGEEPPRTDARGVATLAWTPDAAQDGPVARRSRRVHVSSPRHGDDEVAVVVRTHRAPVLSAFAVRGAALTPGLEGRVFVRVVAPDGAPLAGRELTLEAPRLGGAHAATTDADGVAVIDAPVAERGARDACGGPTATEATLVVGEHRERLCLPVDPDATLAVHADAPTEPGAVAFEVRRRRAVASAPVELTALERVGDGWRPVARAHLPPGESGGTVALPPATRGEVWLRARPLLDGGRAARGGGALVFRAPATAPVSLEADAQGARVSEGEGTWVVHAVARDRADALESALRDRLGPVGAAIDAGRTEAHVAAWLAARTPIDEAASVVWREGELFVQPLPSEPVAHGLLRDPWRTRARFVRGRIGRLMRAVEDYVGQHVPDDLEEVAVRDGRGWRFNHAVLDAAAAHAGLADEAVTALDGEPLDIETLAAMDRSFTYDRVARRITRQRLFSLLVMLRQLVRERGLDRPWARRGDPRLLVSALVEAGDISFHPEWPRREALFDAWGHPFVLHRSPGGGRFDFLEPVEGYVLASAGPDGRVGTADDVDDPFERVLPSGGLYAEAVGEDALLARLNGVALGRATVEALAEVFEVSSPEDAVRTVARVAGGGWHALPDPLPAAPDAAAVLEPPTAPYGGRDTTEWALPPERRAWSAVGLFFGADGSLRSARDRFVAGAPWTARLELPEVMRPGERLRVPLTLIHLDEGAPGSRPRVDVRVRGPAVRARREGDAVRLEARRPGLAEIAVAVDSDGVAVESFRATVRVVPEGALRARHAGTLVSSQAALAVDVPDGARPWRARVVVGAPRALVSDPLFEAVRARHPAVVAWGRAMAGAPADPALAVAVHGARGDVVEAACALVGWTLREDEDAPVDETTRRLVAELPADLGTRAAILAALAPAAPSGPEGSGALGGLLGRLRQDGWRALGDASDRPAVMARMAAALLLADRRDRSGRALLTRVVSRLATDAHGRRWVPGDAERAGDGWVGTLAAAIAARQAGDDALADELAGNALGRLYLVPRTGSEGAFWAAAASVYGAFGVDAPEAVELTIDGRARRVALEGGVASVPIPPSARVAVASERPVWARVESRYLVSWARPAEDAPMRVAVEGSPGALGGRAGLELVVAATEARAVGAPVVEVALPGAARLDEAGRAAMARAEAVRRVDAPDGAGVVRIHLTPLPVDGVHRVPLPLRWIASGDTRGLAIAAYDAAEPTRIDGRDGRRLRIGGGAEGAPDEGGTR